MSEGIVTPTPEDLRRLGVATTATENAIRDIEQNRNSDAAAVLQKLARAIIAAVQQVDAQHDVSRYAARISVSCLERGLFNLEIVDRNSGVDAQQLADQLANSVRQDRPTGQREQRIVQLEIKTQ